MTVDSDIIDIRAPRYERIGGCNRCGDCCVAEECEFFVPGEVSTCTIHDDVPEKCAIAPALPPIPRCWPNCSYRFLDKWTGRVLGPGEI